MRERHTGRHKNRDTESHTETHTERNTHTLTEIHTVKEGTHNTQRQNKENQKQQNTNTFTDTENKLVVTSEEREVGGARYGLGIMKYTLIA